MNDKVLILRTCNADMTSRNGFQWPTSGPVSCPDWSPEPKCGHGLHGLLEGQGDATFLDWTNDAKWLVVRCDRANLIHLGAKVKFPRGDVVYCGDREGAMNFLAAQGIDPTKCAGGATKPNGYGAAAQAGPNGTITIQWWDAQIFRSAVGYVGADGTEPHTP